MNTTMYVITHKSFEMPQISGYKSLLVGANNINLNNIKLSMDYYDNTGKNISNKNKNYCELTGLYWMWKNSNSEILGLCHYRRYFTNAHIGSKEKKFLDAEDIEKIFKKYDVVVPKKRYYKEKVIQAVNIAPNMDDIKEMERAILNVSPEYIDAYYKFLNGNKCYLYNMCIMRKKILDQYCNWLFKILDFIENEYEIDNSDPYRSRLFGFLSERLIYVWLIKNIDKLRIKEVRVVKTDEKQLWLIGQEIKNHIRNIVYHLKERKS